MTKPPTFAIATVLATMLALSAIAMAGTGCGSNQPAAPPANVAIPTPPSAEPPPKDAPQENDERTSGELDGRWAFTHGDEPWFRARISSSGQRIRVAIEGFEESISWTEFRIDAVRRKGPLGYVFETSWLDDTGHTEISLRLVEGGRRLTGTVFGDSYDEPFEVEGNRVR